ncbi:MAG: hypothetical protein QNL29_07205, partial [Crocinitomicaceae bacterium]
MNSFSLNIQNNWLIRILFAVLFLYLILRALFVEPLLDELGTLHWYIETGNIINEKSILDANNHILNSYVSHHLFRFVGDHLIVYRLLALISFPIYFFSAKKLVTENIKQFPLIVFIALISIHWVFDYFSLSRGYAPSVAFFMLGLSFVSAWNRENKPIHLAIILTSFVLSLGSNLSMFVPILLFFAYLHLSLLMQWQKRQLLSKITSYIISAGFIYIAYKLFKYVLKLKEAGALWWGSKKGLWEVTGKSVSENIFFTGADYIKYGLLILYILLIILLIKSLSEKGIKEFILSPQFWSFSLFTLSLIGTFLLVKIMNLNYPEDRVAMYLVILLIIAFGSIATENRILSWSVLILLWFPLSFIVKLNLNTSVFSPTDRMHHSFYKDVQKMVGPNDVLTADYVSHLCYSYEARKEGRPKMAVLNESEMLNGETYHLTSYYGKVKNWSNYTCVLFDSITKMRLYKSDATIKKTLLLDTIIKSIESNELYLPLIEFQFLESNDFEMIRISINGNVDLPNGLLSLDLVQDVVDEDHNSLNYNSTLFQWYFGMKKSYSFNYSRNLNLEALKGKALKVYMYNPE